MITITSNSKGANENARNSVKATSGVQTHTVERDRWYRSALGDYRSAGGSAGLLKLAWTLLHQVRFMLDSGYARFETADLWCRIRRWGT